MKPTKSALLILFCLFVSLSSKATTPPLINYQSLISGPGGQPLDTTVTVSFSIWDAPTLGNNLWTETHTSLAITDGKLSVLLGSITAITDQLFSDTGRYLGVKIGDDSELSPRSRLLSVPYALRLATLDGASGGDVAGALQISADPAKATGDALIINNTSGSTVMKVNASAVGVAISLFDPVDSKDGVSLVPIEKVLISQNDIIMLDSTGSDTTILISSTGDISGSGQIIVGPNSFASSTATVFGENNTAAGISASISGGLNNSSAGDYAAIGGGVSNSAAGSRSTVGGGEQNDANSGYSTVAGGLLNNASGAAAAVGGGTNNEASGSHSLVGGGYFGEAEGNYSTVGGGSFDTAKGDFSGVFSGYSNLAGDSITDTAAFVGGGYNNQALSKFATVAGGFSNNASEIGSTIGGGGNNTTLGVGSTIAGGSGNSTSASDGSTIGGGNSNTANGYASTIAGGESNTVSGSYSFVGGGQFDTAYGLYSGVASGYSNLAGDASADTGAFVGGGFDNQATARYATVSGGVNDTASGSYSIIPGGRGNIASSDYAFAAGRLARAVHAGAFVWKDATTTALSSTTLNQFSARASGGVRFYTNSNDTSGVTMGAGASSWTSVSDKSVKKDFREINSEELLEKLSEIPISRWKYIAEESQADHIGPMSQDFYSAFGLGDDNKRISTIDADGVALAAIQALYKQVEELKAEIKRLKEEKK